MSAVLPFAAPGIVLGARPEQPERTGGGSIITQLDRFAGRIATGLRGRSRANLARLAERVAGRAAEIAAIDAKAWQASLAALRAGLARDGATDRHSIEALAMAGVASRRTLGIAPHPNQFMAARVMLDRKLAEMATGEGKTLAMAMAAATAALSGAPVHVITANDYLAARDAEHLAALFAALGLRVATVGQALGRDARREAYAADITYCTARELAFDYLRDGLFQPRAASDLALRARRLTGRLAPQQRPVLRGLCVALVDEADTVLIDEARVPLVLSRSEGQGDETALLADALALAGQFEAPADFDLRESGHEVALTAAGRARIAAATLRGGRMAGVARHREDCVRMALRALHCLARDRDYVVGADGIAIVDETTGRIAHGRAWSRGLQQLVEMKEGVKPSAAAVTTTQITYQRFFSRYLHLAGMSGTLAECAGEMRSVYGLAMVRIAARAPSRRQALPARLFGDTAALFRAVAARAAALSAAGRPVLVGTASVAESEHLSRLLSAAGLEHALLNARDEGAEAAIIAMAGQPGRITVATSMAGRGTDIAVAPQALAAGGLHVILCQHNNSRRIDRQFIGRAARRGEPGSFETWRALDTPLFARHVAASGRDTLCRLAARLPRVAAVGAALPQWLEERAQSSQRKRLYRSDDRSRRALAFSGGTTP